MNEPASKRLFAVEPRFLKEGWWWYRYETPIGTNHVPVYVEQDSAGEWLISEAPGEEENQPIGYVGELEGEIVQWIGEAPKGEN